MLVAKNLWRYYGSKVALRGMDLEVEAGSAYGFIGPNGAGKSTTLRILATVDQPEAGQVFIDGVDAQEEPAKVRPWLGFMPDPFHLYDELTVSRMLYMFAQLYGIPARERRARVSKVIELARIKQRVGQKCSTLSKGWRQRVLLARTLVHDPKVLLLDEPAAGLDPAARIEFREIVRNLRDMGKTIVVSSHILTELADFCDAVGIVEGGRMVVSGRIADVLDRLNPHDRLEIEVVGDPTTASILLGRLDEVDAVEATERGAVHLLSATLQGRATPELRSKVLRDLVQAGVQVSALQPKREDLEDLFLKVASQGSTEGGVRVETLRSLLKGGAA
ncbi:MAG: ABC transporter ATP-binding protein [Planctomycetes bacterium]|nr:ABC transporter ATP-binding protein [Planctomycetota bacterium]